MNINYDDLVHGDDETIKSAFKKFYDEILKLKKEEQIEKFLEMIQRIARETNDEEYSHMCKLSMEVLLSMKNVNLKEIMAVRLEAQFELPEEDKLVDSVNLLRAIESMPEKEKLLDLIKSIER
ncbi:hypothetical protein ACNF40_04275 [Cuniculiplasma sp. SKW4]|uniref:hypothetical protein n=1 Tax=Cuniculiplasma sp. SKW4 TaxID=3400171 RepID=UPI003FD2AEE3